MPRVVVLNVVGLTAGLLGDATPRLRAFAREGGLASVEPAFPAVTCTAQSTYLTGLPPAGHGVVANGWYDRELAEVQFWRQSNHLVHGKKLWEVLRENAPGATCAQLFWWYNMYATVDYSITPRPLYLADGRKVFDIYAWPYSIRTALKRDLGDFPFPTFWGPAAGVDSRLGAADAASRWIAASARWLETRYQPTLSLVYLPHLDYSLQRLGPDDPAIRLDLQRVDALVGELLDFYAAHGVRVVVLSEYGITAVDTPVHLNRVFRQQGWLAIKDELGREMLDCGASRVFAVADHQVAHVYLNDSSLASRVPEVIGAQPGIEAVLDRQAQKKYGLDHARSGDWVAVAAENAWFTYYYWLDDRRAPDFARCVDIHRKPGYDPAELFLDPAIPAVRLKILWRLLQKRLGFRMLMDVIPLDANLVKGSHGRRTTLPAHQPVLITGEADWLPAPAIRATDVCGLIRRAVEG